MPQLLQASRHVHFRHTCMVWTTYDIVCTFWHFLPLIGFFHWENSKKDKTWQKPIQFGMVPWIQGHEKMGSFTGCREMRCSQTYPSGLFEHSPLNMVFLWKYQDCPNFCKQVGMPMLGIHAWSEWLEMIPTFSTRWACPHRHPCQVWTSSDTLCKLRLI